MPLLPAAARHLALGLRQLRRTPAPVPVVRQIEPLVGGGRGPGHAPVDPDGRPFGSTRCRVTVTGDDEGGVPVPERVAEDAHTRRLGRQLPRPHHRDTHALVQHQSVVADPETAAGVFERRQGVLPRLERRSAPPLHREGGVQCSSVGAQRLLLGDLGTVPQPRPTGPGCGQQLAQFRERRLPVGPGLVHGFVPEEPAAMPLLDQSALGSGARPQPVAVTHYLGPHGRNANRPHRQFCPASPTPEGGRRFLSLVNEGVSAPNTR